MPLRAVFWGNSRSVFSSRHFEALLDEACQLVAVVDVPSGRRESTNKLPTGSADFVDIAHRRGIPALSPGRPGQSEFLAELEVLAPDLFLVAGYALILPPATLAIPTLLAANFHASLLPAFRGKHPVFWALRAGERWAGLTVHVMDPGIDTGDIIYQVKVRTRRDDSVASLYERIMARSVPLVGQLVLDAEHGTIPRQPQPIGVGSYFSSTVEEDFFIDWAWPAEQVWRHIATTPGKCFTFVGGRKLYLAQARRAARPQGLPPGTLSAAGRSGCVVAAADGGVWIGRARLEEGAEQPMASICRQIGLKVGDRLA